MRQVVPIDILYAWKASWHDIIHEGVTYMWSPHEIINILIVEKLRNYNQT